LGGFSKWRFFFSRLVGRVPIKIFFSRVPNFKLDYSGWLRSTNFYPPLTQVQEITVIDLTIVTGHPV
jgi:hypothetical protein